METQLKTPEEAAKFLGITKETLAIWRCTQRYALPYIKTGRLVRYRAEDLLAFVQARMVGGAQCLLSR